jgi:hypothetical protein
MGRSEYVFALSEDVFPKPIFMSAKVAMAISKYCPLGRRYKQGLAGYVDFLEAREEILYNMPVYTQKLTDFDPEFPGVGLKSRPCCSRARLQHACWFQNCAAARQ